MRLLEAFLPGQESLTLSDMGRSAGLPLSTTHRLAQDLTEWGALERTDCGRYRIGSKLRQVASMASRGRLLRELCLPVMEDLAASTGYTALLAVLEGSDVAFIENVSGPKFDFRPAGRRGLALTTAAGRVLVAFSNASVQREILEKAIPVHSGRTVTSPSVLRKELAEIRRTRLSFADRQSSEAFIGVAAPITGETGNVVVAALSVAMPFDAPDAETVAALCAAAARTVSR
ncbi:IclR family transcriptional regulator [Pseudarthrobacter sp. DSP2-3-2b1]|uniref:IclR family transcriptional regulator n=1 Tax=Pseudarthrobacter sp. DSP2-3-2b1 TaxID=2804661 RepID=UPI003CF34AEA